MTKISELSAHQLSQWFWDPTVTNNDNMGKRLKAFYRATEFPLTDAVVLRLIGIYDLLHVDQCAPIMVALVEYLLTLDLTARTRQLVAAYRLHVLRRSGIAEHAANGGRNYAWHENPSECVVDEAALHAVLTEGLGHNFSLDSAFEVVRTMIGLFAGVHRHKVMGYSVSFEEFRHRDRFEATGAYEKFLESDISALDEYAMIGNSDCLELSRIALQGAEGYNFNEAYLSRLYFSANSAPLTDDAAVAFAAFGTMIADWRIAVALNEYLLSVIHNEQTRRNLYTRRHLLLLLCGIATRVESVYSGRNFKDFGRFPEAFHIDSDRLTAVIQSVLGPTAELRLVFEAVGRMAAVRAGLARHKTLPNTADIPEREYFYAELFDTTQAYLRVQWDLAETERPMSWLA